VPIIEKIELNDASLLGYKGNEKEKGKKKRIAFLLSFQLSFSAIICTTKNPEKNDRSYSLKVTNIHKKNAISNAF